MSSQVNAQSPKETFNIMENNGSEVAPEFDETTKVNDGRKLVHQFYFVKFWPTDPDSISKIKEEEDLFMKMYQDICEITERITKKMSEKKYLDDSLLRLKRLNYSESFWRKQVVSEEKKLKNLYLVLDELNFMNKAAKGEELDKKSFNFLMLHGRKSLAKEKQILKDIKFQLKDVASLKALEVLKKSDGAMTGKFLRDIEQFQIQYMERTLGNDFLKGDIPNYESLKKNMEDQIKLVYNDTLASKRTWKEWVANIRHGEKELEDIDRELHSLSAKLPEKHKKKGEAYQRSLKLKCDGEIIRYYNYCSLRKKVHELAEKKDIAALDEMSNSEVEKFMLKWNNDMAFREDYKKKVLQSLERRELSKDGRRRPDKSCNVMLL